MENLNKNTAIKTLLLFVVLSLSLTSAANIGITPANVEFEDVLRGGFAERVITITSDSVDDILVELDPRGK